MNVPYKAFIVFGDYRINPTTTKKVKDEVVEQDEKVETEQNTLVELELADDDVNKTVLDALALLNKVFVHEQKSDTTKIDKK